MSEPDPPKLSASKEVLLDQSFYTWTNMFKGMLGFLSPEEVRMYNAVHVTVKEDVHIRMCDENKDWAFKYSPIVRFLRQQCAELGGDINSSNVRCRPCRSNQFAGFDPEYGIVLCSDQLASRSRKDLEDSLAHEMIHAYDYLRFKFDRTNMKHAACTEIRAAMLSGECRFFREFWKRGNYNITRGFQECVRRRAATSMMGRSAVKDYEEAEKHVNLVWESCFRDTRPFDEIYK